MSLSILSLRQLDSFDKLLERSRFPMDLAREVSRATVHGPQVATSRLFFLSTMKFQRISCSQSSPSCDWRKMGKQSKELNCTGAGVWAPQTHDCDLLNLRTQKTALQLGCED
jgi:hypothetical protein